MPHTPYVLSACLPAGLDVAQVPALALRTHTPVCACSQCAETLSEEVLGKMHAPPKNETVPVVDTHKLPEADGTPCLCKRCV